MGKPGRGAPMIAMLGTGTMGAPMARNMAEAGLDLRVWNRTKDKAEPLSGDGIDVAGSAEEAVAGADVVITMLADGDSVASVMEDGGALAAMPDDALWLQMSTVGIAATEALATLAEERSVPFVDAPVLGTKAPAEQGKLQVLASGPEDQRERCRPIFDAVGADTQWLGEAGAGTRTKLVLNNWLLTLTEGTAETIALAEALDVDPRIFLSTIEGGPLDSAYAQMKGGAMIERSLRPLLRPVPGPQGRRPGAGGGGAPRPARAGGRGGQAPDGEGGGGGPRRRGHGRDLLREPAGLSVASAIGAYGSWGRRPMRLTGLLPRSDEVR